MLLATHSLEFSFSLQTIYTHTLESARASEQRTGFKYRGFSSGTIAGHYATHISITFIFEFKRCSKLGEAASSLYLFSHYCSLCSPSSRCVSTHHCIYIYIAPQQSEDESTDPTADLEAREAQLFVR